VEIPDGIREQAALAFGVNPEAMQVLGGSDGVSYACQRDRQGMVIKIMPVPAGEEQQARERNQARLRFIAYLGAHQVPVARPISTLAGERLLWLQTPDGVYAATAAERATGHHVQARFMNEWNEALWERWGGVMGRMHALTPQFEAEQGHQPLGDWREEMEGFIAWCDDEDVRPHWLKMRSELEALLQPPDAYGLIHNDVHPHNFMVDGEALTVLDFDVSHYHWFGVDIGIAVFHALWMRLPTRFEPEEAFALRFLRAFMRGYRQQHTLPVEWLAHLPLFIDYRRLLMHTVFSHEWAERPAPWQTRTLQAWRRGILRQTPTVALQPVDLARL
jgi:Ser/Thr protein kinase RdoA (MazF antagonist)